MKHLQHFGHFTSLLESSNNGKLVYDAIIKAAKSGPGGLGTDEEGMLNAVTMLKTKEDYDTTLGLVKKTRPVDLTDGGRMANLVSGKEPFKTIMHLISYEMPYHPKGLIGTAQRVTSTDDKKYLEKMSAHLIKFNSQEVIYDKK